MTSMTYTDPTQATPPLFWIFTNPKDRFWVTMNRMMSDSKRAWFGVAAVVGTVFAQWGTKKFMRYLTFFILPLIIESATTDFTSNHGFMLCVAIVTLFGGWLRGPSLLVLAIPAALAYYHWTTDLEVIVPAGTVPVQSVVRGMAKTNLLVAPFVISLISLLVTMNLLLLQTRNRLRWFALAFIGYCTVGAVSNVYNRGIFEKPFPWS